MIEAVAIRIVDELHHPSGLWTKWTPYREEMIRAAAPAWIPDVDLREALNNLPGPKLSMADVVQRLKAVQEELRSWPDDDFKDGCLQLYERERRAGTEMMAIIGSIRDHLEKAEAERRREWDEKFKAQKEADRLSREARFLSGADCGWTAFSGASSVWCRLNGRGYRLDRRKDGRHDMFRSDGVDDQGWLLGTYGTRADASKALKMVAYQPEPRR